MRAEEKETARYYLAIMKGMKMTLRLRFSCCDENPYIFVETKLKLPPRAMHIFYATYAS